MKNSINYSNNDFEIFSIILKAMDDYWAQRTPNVYDGNSSSAYSTSGKCRREEVMERYEYITEQKKLLREALEKQDEEFDFFAYLDEHKITNPRLRKILEHELEAYWDEVAYANESITA